MVTKIPNGCKIDQTATKYTNILHCKPIAKFTQIGIFGFKIKHLATLIGYHLHKLQGNDLHHLHMCICMLVTRLNKLKKFRTEKAFFHFVASTQGGEN
jgi:hypothetical protein